MGDKPPSELFGALHSLYQSRDYSDLIVFSQDGTPHAVHKAILCPRSAFFHTAVKERQWREGNEGHITLPEDDHVVVRLLIEYFYLLDYEPVVYSSKDQVDVSPYGDSSDTMSVQTEAGQYGQVYGTSAVSAFGGPAHPQSPYSAVFARRERADSSLTVHAMPGNDFSPFGRQSQAKQKAGRSTRTSGPDPSTLATSEPNLTLHAKMYAAGHRYGIGGLKTLALDKFKIQLTRHWSSPEFAEAIHVVYNTTPSSDKELREAVADTIGWHNRLLDQAEIEVAILEINGLAYELLKRSRRAEPEYMD